MNNIDFEGYRGKWGNTLSAADIKCKNERQSKKREWHQMGLKKPIMYHTSHEAGY